jgi:hypothetical protein
MNDDQLRRLLSDAVSDIEPEDRLDRLRASVHPRPKVVPMARSRSWYAAGGIVATAAVIGVIAYLTSVVGDKSTNLGPAGDGGTALPTTVATDTAAPQPGSSASPSLVNLPVYYLGHSPRGTVLFRQNTPVSSGTSRLATAVARLMADPYDPDYRLGWSPGWLVSASLAGDGLVRVELGDVPEQRPARMSPRTAYEVVQSAVYTLRAATRADVKVQFLRSGSPVASVLGVPALRPVGPGHVGDVLARVDLTQPAVDGRRTSEGRLVVAGTVQTALDKVVVHLVRRAGAHGRPARATSVLAGPVPDSSGRYRWHVVLDTTRLPAGQYTVVARTGHGTGADTDTRVVVVR